MKHIWHTSRHQSDCAQAVQKLLSDTIQGKTLWDIYPTAKSIIFGLVQTLHYELLWPWGNGAKLLVLIHFHNQVRASMFIISNRKSEGYIFYKLNAVKEGAKIKSINTVHNYFCIRSLASSMKRLCPDMTELQLTFHGKKRSLTYTRLWHDCVKEECTYISLPSETQFKLKLTAKVKLTEPTKCDFLQKSYVLFLLFYKAVHYMCAMFHHNAPSTGERWHWQFHNYDWPLWKRIITTWLESEKSDNTSDIKASIKFQLKKYD